jgi:hypothetical protein
MKEKVKEIQTQVEEHKQEKKSLVKEHREEKRELEWQIWEEEKKNKSEKRSELNGLLAELSTELRSGGRHAKQVALQKVLSQESRVVEDEEEGVEDEDEMDEARSRWTSEMLDIFQFDEGRHRSMTVGEIAMEMMTMDISSRNAVKIYELFVSHLPGAEKLKPADYPGRRYFQRKLKEARVVGLIMNALDLALALEWHSVKGDGTSDHYILHGQQDKYSFVHEITDMTGKKKTVVLDGFLTSWGLTAEQEVKVSLEIMKQLRAVLSLTKEVFAKMYPDLVVGSKWLGPDVDVENIGVKWYTHFGADGAAAAQLWARLMGEHKVKVSTLICVVWE